MGKRQQTEGKVSMDAIKTKTVVFKMTDGRKPTRQGAARSFNLRSPIDITLTPNSERTLDLGISCDHPVHVFQASGPLSQGVVLIDTSDSTVDSNVPLKIKIKNTSNEQVFFGEGETLARCSILDDSEWELA